MILFVNKWTNFLLVLFSAAVDALTCMPPRVNFRPKMLLLKTTKNLICYHYVTKRR